MKVTVRNKHFAASKGYSDIYGCPLALAVQELFPLAIVSVSPGSVFVREPGVNNEARFNYNMNEWDHLRGKTNLGHPLNNMIKSAKAGVAVNDIVVNVPGLKYEPQKR